ncbi:hypothetical protein KP509_03G024600 [Ceratopteris richardii]|uniref:J domain-containing protein n=1 Tax=Ceratopteris richardii TaxID=49495 RepID=A0A8T2V5F5_CERRI|nr:hypothetical protein KP509_03G024600 [Ceratopteris richardii]KAH7441075.1 hypothetical protein KP509_03G024600 [Ceratopteris richardii]
MHPFLKKQPGVHKKESQGARVTVDSEPELVFDESRGGSQKRFNTRNAPNIIVIEDDDGDSEVENHDSEIQSRQSENPYQSSSSEFNYSKSSFNASDVSDSSSDDDCVVVEPHTSVPHWHSSQQSPRTQNRGRSPARRVPESCRKRRSSSRRSSPSDLSDCEIVLDLDGKVKQDWEEAALRRRTGKAMRAESEESTSVSIQANVDVLKSPKGKQRVTVESCRKRSWESSFGEGPSTNAKEREEEGALDQQDSNLNVTDTGSDRSAEEALSDENPSESRKTMTTNVTPTSVDDTVTDREFLKNTHEFRQAEEEEWKRRHLELQKQAKEAQREKKKKRLEAERRIEMEARQKRRLEEMRLTQLKEEQVSGIKGQIREHVQWELERIAVSCKDMATLLRRLGVQVDGGACATDQQVIAAYKKALLCFHPDRSSTMAKGDPRSQVEAEEKFKLVSRMKRTLPLVSSRSLSNKVF